MDEVLEVDLLESILFEEHLELRKVEGVLEELAQPLGFLARGRHRQAPSSAPARLVRLQS
jgi:hypothetical protein